MRSWIPRFAQSPASERQLSWHTQSAYLRDVEQLHASLAGALHREPAPADLDVRALRGFLAKLHGAHEPSSIARKLASVRAFTKFLVRRGALVRDPAASLTSPKQKKLIPKTLTVDEAFALVEAPRAREPEDDTSERGRDLAILELLYGS